MSSSCPIGYHIPIRRVTAYDRVEATLGYADTLRTNRSDRAWGATVFAGTRVPVEILFEYLAAGETLDEFLEQFPSLSREQASGS